MAGNAGASGVDGDGAEAFDGGFGGVADIGFFRGEVDADECGVDADDAYRRFGGRLYGRDAAVGGGTAGRFLWRRRELKRELRALGNHEPKLAQVADLLGDATALLNDAGPAILTLARSRFSSIPMSRKWRRLLSPIVIAWARKHDLSSPALLGGLVADKRAALEALPDSDAAALLEARG